MSQPVQVLSVGTELLLLVSRSLILESAGCIAAYSIPSDALRLLPTSTFNLLIISVDVSEEDRAAIAKAAPEKTRLVQVSGYLSPQALLALIKS